LKSGSRRRILLPSLLYATQRYIFFATVSVVFTRNWVEQQNIAKSPVALSPHQTEVTPGPLKILFAAAFFTTRNGTEREKGANLKCKLNH
jgi:hypothetical protein